MLYRYTCPCTKPTLSICYSISLISISYPTKKPPDSPGFSSRTWVIRNSSSGWVILPDSAKSTSRKRTNLNRKKGHGKTHQKKTSKTEPSLLFVFFLSFVYHIPQKYRFRYLPKRIYYQEMSHLPSIMFTLRVGYYRGVTTVESLWAYYSFIILPQIYTWQVLTNILPITLKCLLRNGAWDFLEKNFPKKRNATHLTEELQQSELTWNNHHES